MKENDRDITVHPKPLELKASVTGPTVWLSDNFAQDWFADALNEARTEQDHNSRRREIIFATCFAESYIFEWVRHVVEIEEVNNYFVPLRIAWERGER